MTPLSDESMDRRRAKDYTPTAAEVRELVGEVRAREAQAKLLGANLEKIGQQVSHVVEEISDMKVGLAGGDYTKRLEKAIVETKGTVADHGTRITVLETQHREEARSSVWFRSVIGIAIAGVSLALAFLANFVGLGQK